MSEQQRALYAGRVGSARKAKGMTQAELAAAAGVSRGTIGNIESATRIPQSAVLWRVMSELDMRADANLEWSESVEAWLRILAPLLDQLTPEVRERVMTRMVAEVAALI